jgi:hypothetical protein
VQAILARTAAVLEVAEAAAASNPDLAARRERGQRNMRADFREVADALDRAGALAAKVTPADAADTIYALAGEDVYLRLTRECGWTGTRYAAWLADTLSAALTRSRAAADPGQARARTRTRSGSVSRRSRRQ